MDGNKAQGELIQYLPQVFQNDAGTRDFLLAFEQILLGSTLDADQNGDESVQFQGLEKIIDRLATYFDPETEGLPSGFLLWLGQWVALSLRLDVDEETRKTLTAQAVQLYRLRGTKTNMEKLLRIFTGDTTFRIEDQIEGKPHYFEVYMDFNKIKTSEEAKAYHRREQIAHSVIQAEKPTHTYYKLIPQLVTLRIGSQAEKTPFNVTVGINTRLGIAKWK